MGKTNSSPEEILSAIRASHRILINMDTRTDIDAICSSKLVKWWAGKLGKTADIIHANELRQSHAQYFDCTDIKPDTDISDVELSVYDLVIFVDSGDAKHVSLQENFTIPKEITSINIDHHPGNDHFGKLNYVIELGSCCSALYELFRELKVDLDDYSRRLIAFGVITDTGFFNFNSTKAEDFRIVADLSDSGIKVYEIMNTMKNLESLDQIKFKNLVYSNLKVVAEEHYAYSTITLKEISDRGIDVNKVYVRHADLLRYIDSVDFSFVVSEISSQPKVFELSLRSKDPSVDVSKMAKVFGGGGHTTGAGAKIYEAKDVDSALQIVKTKLNLEG